MANKMRTIQTLEALDNEIYRQRLKAKSLEKKLDENFDYLHENYGSLVKKLDI